MATRFYQSKDSDGNPLFDEYGDPIGVWIDDCVLPLLIAAAKRGPDPVPTVAIYVEGESEPIWRRS